MSDLRYAVRTLVKAPWLSLVIVLSLALGIGANATVFSWLNTSLFHPIPAVSAEVVGIEPRNSAGSYVGSSWLEYHDLLERLPSLSNLAVQRPRTFTLGDGDRGERVWGEFVSGNFFDLLGLHPAQGRFFRPDEVSTIGSAPVAIISHQFWQRQFGGRADALGSTFKLNGHTLTVIGVAPAHFIGGLQNLTFEVWLPVTMMSELMPASQELTTRGRSLMLIATLRPGVEQAKVTGELASAAAALASAYPESNTGLVFDLLPLWRNPRGGAVVSGLLATLQIFAALVLVIVCVNTANLLLARASVRQREIGIRLACGAGAGRIIRQLLTESLLLALAGSVLGALLALWGIDLLGHLPVPTSIPAHFSAVFDWRSVAFAAVVGTVCGVLFGLAPALQLARSDVQQALRGGRGSVGGRSRLRNVLIGTEVAVALIVLVLAGLFLKSFRNAQSARPGFERDHVLLASADLIGRGLSEAGMKNFLRDSLALIQALPGVEAVSAVNSVPLDVRGTPKATIGIDGARPLQGPPGSFAPTENSQIVYFRTTPGYFATMRTPLVAGSDLASLSQDNRPLDAVINEEMARHFWPGRSTLGHKFSLEGREYEVVGVARDGKYDNLAERTQPAAWVTSRGTALASPIFQVRVTSGDPLALQTSLRGAIRTLDADLALYDTRTLEQHIDNNLVLQRAPTQLLSVLAPLALGLAAIGLYAVLAYAVAQRTQEIGVRLTLGATPGTVVMMIVREGMKVVLIGAAVGWVVVLIFGYNFSARLVGVPVGDPVIYVGIPLLLLAVAALACWLPARRAAKVDPMIALRND